MRKLLLLNVAALSPWEIGVDCPQFANLASAGGMRPLMAPEPALTCTSHATMLTGQLPKAHGIVGNGWYEESHGKIFNWGRSDKLVTGQKLWEAMHARAPSTTAVNLFWRYCTHSTCNLTLTERPTYHSNGRKGADVYASELAFKHDVVQRFGAFPFFHFWGPKAGLNSSRWIVNVARHVIESKSPDLLMVYAPGLDYDGQRFGPKSEIARQTLREGDQIFGELIADAQRAGMDVAVVSDYGFTTVERPIYLNRALREAGFVAVDAAANGDWLETNASRAFAVCDNQSAHVYVRHASDIDAVRSCLEGVPGVREVLGPDPDASVCLGHERSGQLLAIAEPDAWFAYPYWMTDDRAPDFAKCVDIFNKPGFDPSEMFMREGFAGKLHVAKRFLQLKLGIRAPFDVISTRHEQVRGARNIRPAHPSEGAVCITSWANDWPTTLSMVDLKSQLLARMFSDA
ncbi:MAG: alkaline phosphatase family protein [Myxococcota bacterium]|nr:alkaline phosphatase family protein [Myxococcota bacterium]